MERETENKLNPEFKLNEWGPGPWVDEPDRVEFESNGLPCLMLRQQRLGHWCGYVAVPPGHPWHGKPYHDYDYETDRSNNPETLEAVSVHGGLAYADACAGNICHVPKPGEPDNVWWFGFDCAHGGDASPSMARRYGLDGVYRDAGYVRAEVEGLAKQAAAAAEPGRALVTESGDGSNSSTKPDGNG